MSIVSISSKLREAAGPDYTITQVRLGYGEGGKKQVLTYLLSCNKPGHKCSEVKKVHVIPGEDDPVKYAVEIGAQLARDLLE